MSEDDKPTARLDLNEYRRRVALLFARTDPTMPALPKRASGLFRVDIPTGGRIMRDKKGG